MNKNMHAFSHATPLCHIIYNDKINNQIKQIIQSNKFQDDANHTRCKVKMNSTAQNSIMNHANQCKFQGDANDQSNNQIRQIKQISR